METCRLVPVMVPLVTPEELQELADGVKLRELRPRIAARILKREIARRINHHPGAVNRYTNDDERIGQLWQEGKSPEMISFITGLSLTVVQEYIEIRQEMQRQSTQETQES